MTAGDSAMRVQEANVKSPFANLVATEPVEAVGAHIATAVALVKAYADLEIGSEERVEVVLAMAERLTPIAFPTRIEPRAAITSAWREATDLASSRFFAAIDSLLLREDANWRPIHVRLLLELLREAALTAPAATAFLAQRRLKLDFDRWQEPAPMAALMSLVPNNSGSIFSMIERLDSDGILDPRSVQTAVRKISSWDPESLGRSLALFGNLLFASEETLDTIQFFLADIIERAGSSPVMLALSGMEPEMAPSLFKAAFGGAEPPFEILLEIDGASADKKAKRWLRQGSRKLLEGQLGEAAQDPAWMLKVRLQSRAAPLVTVVEGLSSSSHGADYPDGYLDACIDMIIAESDDNQRRDDDDDGDISLSRQFAEQMNIRLVS